MVCICSMIQSSVQALLRPAVWMPGVRNLHSHRESWKTNIPAEECLEKTIKGLETVIHGDHGHEFYDIHKIDREKHFIRIFAFTWAEWLDVVEITCFNGRADVYSFSSGVLPTSIPFACLLNCVFFFVPFYDNRLNQKRITLLREAMGIPLIVQ